MDLDNSSVMPEVIWGKVHRGARSSLAYLLTFGAGDLDVALGSRKSSSSSSNHPKAEIEYRQFAVPSIPDIVPDWNKQSISCVKELFPNEWDVLSLNEKATRCMSYVSRVSERLQEPSGVLSLALKPYASESDVETFVITLVRDLVEVLSIQEEQQLTAQLKVKHMVKYPDIVIRTMAWRFVGYVEVKKDGEQHPDLRTNPFHNETIAGQLYTYCRLLEDDCVADAFGMLHTGKRCARVAANPNGNRGILMSQVASNNEMVAMTMKCISDWMKAHVGRPDTSKWKREIPPRPTQILDPISKTMTSSCSHSSGLDFSAFQDINPGGRMVLWNHLGSGAFCSCFLGSDEYGRACAVKVVKRWMPEDSAQSLANELKAIKNIYTRKNGWPSSVVQLFYHCCDASGKSAESPFAILLPICARLPVEYRKDRLDEVQVCLSRLAESGYKYTTPDLAWRHIMLLQNEIVLVDFGSLERLPRDQKQLWVDAAMYKLKETIDKEMSDVVFGGSSTHSLSSTSPPESPNKQENGD